MAILTYVNPATGRKTIRGRAKIGKRKRSKHGAKNFGQRMASLRKRRSRARNIPRTHKYKVKRKKRYGRTWDARHRKPVLANPARGSKKARRARKRSTDIMAKKKKRRSSASRRARAAKKGWAKRRARKAARSASAKRARRKGRKSSRKRARRKSRRTSRKSRRRSRKRGRATAARLGHARRRRRRKPGHGLMFGPRKSQRGRHTVKGYKQNPSRRRRRKAKRSRRSYARAARLGRRRKRRYGTKRARSIARRYRRKHRRNPSFGGGFALLKGVLKQAVPIGIAILGVNYVTAKITPRLTFLSSLGGFGGVAVAAAMIGVAHFATKKVKSLGKYRQPIMIGTGLIAAKELAAAILPASVKSMIGMGDAISDGLSDYVAVDDYIGVEGMSDYVAVGALEQELGLDQELGFTAELGDVPGGGWSGQANLGGMRQSSMLAPVPGRKFLAPVPARSFTEEVPGVSAGYDNSNELYDGIFAGSRVGY